MTRKHRAWHRRKSVLSRGWLHPNHLVAIHRTADQEVGLRLATVGSVENELNRSTFDEPGVVADYLVNDDLTPPEARLFERHIPPGRRVLDLGVGTGRTTSHLAPAASRYVGIDYAPAMVAAARDLHPGVDLRVGDAMDLRDFEDGSFDVVVFSYNGLDYLHPDDARARCISECRRVMSPTGVLVLSRHNPRCLVDWPTREADGIRWVAAAALMSGRRAIRQVRTRAFWRGSGYVMDAARGGLWTHMTTPDRWAEELRSAGLEIGEAIGSRSPGSERSIATPWWYYAIKRTATGSGAVSAVGR